jgi:hypothetical protein
MKLGLLYAGKMIPPAVSLVANRVMTSSLVTQSSTVLSNLPAMVGHATPVLSALAVRGGEAALQGFDLNRTKIRLESISSYGVVTGAYFYLSLLSLVLKFAQYFISFLTSLFRCYVPSISLALLMNAALRLYGSTPKRLEKDKIENSFKILFVLSVGISIICGAYSTVCFSLLGLYSKTALGQGLDASFLEFYAATADVRDRAFRCFIIALLSFEVCFVSSLFLNYDGKLRWWVSGLAAAASLISWLHWQNIIAIAGELLFKS